MCYLQPETYFTLGRSALVFMRARSTELVRLDHGPEQYGPHTPAK